MSYDARGFIRRWRRASAPRRRSRCPFESPSAARVNFPDVKDVFGGAREEEEEEEGEEAMIGVDRTPRGATILPASLEDDAEAARARELADCTIEKIANECPADITTPGGGGGGGGGGGDGDGDDASEDELVAARRLAKEAREEFRCHEYFARKTTAALAGARDPVLSSPWSPWSPTEKEEEEDPSPASSVPSPWAPQTARPPPPTTRGESVRGGRARVGLGRRAGTARDGDDDDQLDEFSPVRWQSARIPSPSPMPPPRRARGRKKKTAGIAVDRGVFVDVDDGDAADAVSFTAALEKSLSFDGVKSGLYELFSRCATEPEPATTAADAATATDDLTENDAGGDGDASIDSFEDDDDGGSAPGIKAFADISPIAVYRAGPPLRVAAANAVVVVDAAAAAAAEEEEEDDDASPSRRALFAEEGAEAEEEEDSDRHADDDASPTRTPARDASSSLPPPPSRPPRLAKDRRKSRTRVYDEETELDDSVVSAIATRLRMEDVALDDVAEVDVGVDVESELASDAAEEVDSDSDLEFPSMVEVDDDDDDEEEEEEEDAMPTPTAAFATAVGPTLAPATPRLDPPATRRGLLPPIRGARVAVDENSPLSPPAPLPPSPTAAAVGTAAVGESIVVVDDDDDDSRATEETRIALDAERERTPGSAFGRPGYAAASPSESAESAESSREMTSTSTSTAASASASASAAGATTAGADAGVFLDDSAARNSSIGNSATKQRGDMTDEMKTYLGLDADGLPREDDSAGKKPTRGAILKFGGAGGSERKQLDFEAIETHANATSEDPRAFTKELRRILAELKSEDAATTR